MDYLNTRTIYHIALCPIKIPYDAIPIKKQTIQIKITNMLIINNVLVRVLSSPCLKVIVLMLFML